MHKKIKLRAAPGQLSELPQWDDFCSQTTGQTYAYDIAQL